MSKQLAKIAILRPLPPAALKVLGTMGHLIGADCGAPLTGVDAAAVLKDADAAFITGLDPFGEDVFANAPDLRFVSSVGVGTDHIDLGACARRGITVANTPDAPTEATADLVFALILATARRVVEGDRFVRAGRWSPDIGLAMGGDVHGKTLGIIGFGRIGAAVARRAQGFGMPILYSARSDKTLAKGLLATRVITDDILAQADFVVVQTPLTSETRNMIDGPQFSRMKPSAILINAARGGVVNETALVKALIDGEIAGAALDVFEGEPTINPALLTAPNLVMTPHIGSATVETRQGMFTAAVENLTKMLTNFESR